MQKLFYCLIILLIAGCRQRYDSPVKSPVTGYLVVDGVINSGPDSTAITLSRTTKFDNKSIVYETGAAVNVQGEDSSVHLLTESGKGLYVAGNLHLNNALKYRLRISTSDGKKYASDFAAIKNNPPIDSISWKLENGGLQLYINTHDPLNNTRYYQWYFDETWEIHSSYTSSLKYKIVQGGGVITYSVVYRDSSTFSWDPSIITCWQFNKPYNIFISSTAKLSQDIIYLPLQFIPKASVKLSALYSMHLKQYAWTKEGYEFLDRMRKNTETTGSVFDPQPSELNSNIHNIADATEPVIGYFNICPVQQSRIFIRNGDVPGWGYSSNCTSVEIENISDSIMRKGIGLLPTEVVKLSPLGTIAIFTAATPECVDCTLRGTNKKPAYWP